MTWNTTYIIIWGCFGVYLILHSIFQSQITKNKMKPNTVSRLFYKDDVSFIKSWKKTKERGILRWSIKCVISSLLFWGTYFWLISTPAFNIINDFKENKPTWLVMSIILIILTVATTEMRWNKWEDKYRTLKGETPSDQL